MTDTTIGGECKRCGADRPGRYLYAATRECIAVDECALRAELRDLRRGGATRGGGDRRLHVGGRPSGA